MIQPTLPFVRHSATSRAAAESVVNAGTLRALVLEHIAECGEHGATDEEIQFALSLGGNCERPRRRELQKGGRIKDSGRTRPTKSGRQAVVWIVKH